MNLSGRQMINAVKKKCFTNFASFCCEMWDNYSHLNKTTVEVFRGKSLIGDDRPSQMPFSEQCVGFYCVKNVTYYHKVMFEM